MENFADHVNYRTREGFTPLIVAARAGSAACAVQLLNHGGIDVDAVELNNQNALDVALYYNRQRVLAAMLENM
jgi:ankyrin repeat protein